MTKTNKLSDPIFKKVLFIGPDLRGRGGMSSVLASYAENFEYFNYLATNSDKGKFAGILQVVTTFFRLPWARLKGRKIVHVHYCGGKSWKRKEILLAWARFWGYKTVTHCHDGGMDVIVKKVGAHIFQKELDKAKCNIVLSKYWEGFFNETFKSPAVTIVNNIVSKPRFLDDYKREDSTPTFLFLGYIDNPKGIFDILKAVDLLKKENKKFKLIVGGNGKVEEFKKMVKELNIEDRVDFRGWMRNYDKIRAFMESDVLMLPSKVEGLPIAVLEAMSYGKGIITTPVGGIPEILTDGVNSIMVVHGDVSLIAEAMRKYIDNPELIEAHAANSSKIIENFYPERVAAQLVKIYQSIL